MAEEDKQAARQMIRDWVKRNQEKYGPDWKSKLAAEMAAKTAPTLERLLELQK